MNYFYFAAVSAWMLYVLKEVSGTKGGTEKVELIKINELRCLSQPPDKVIDIENVSSAPSNIVSLITRLIDFT